MNILHTSDWHLGKRLQDRDRLAEQEQVLGEIADICDERAVDVVLIAGDVFDTYLPPAEAEELFYRAAKRLATERAVVAVSGNHDDGVRLAAASALAGEEGIYLFGGTNPPVPGGKRRISAVEVSDHHIILENETGERLYINACPYPNEARLKEDKTDETYAEKTRRRILAGDDRYDGTIPHILLTHLFILGGKVSDSERDVSLGGARAVPAEDLPAFGYTALGHLHRPQPAGKFGSYSGSILQYSFDESPDKCVVLLKTCGTDVLPVERIPLGSGKRLVRLEANGPKAGEELLAQYPDCFIELTLHLTAPLTREETRSLHAANSGLVSLVTLVESGPHTELVSRAALDPSALFDEFYRSQFGTDPEPALKEEFLLLLEEEK